MSGAEDDNTNAGANLPNTLEDESEMVYVVPDLEINYLENIDAAYQSSSNIASEIVQNVPINSDNQPVEDEEEDNPDFDIGFGSDDDHEDESEMVYAMPELEMIPLQNVVTVYQSSSDLTSENMQNIPIDSGNQPVEVEEEDNSDIDLDFGSDNDNDHDHEDVIGEDENSWW